MENLLLQLDSGDSFALTVTKELIEESDRAGGRSNVYTDPIALAIKAALKEYGCTGAMAGWGYANSYHQNNIVVYWNLEPRNQLQSWMKLWDRGKMVPPITLRMSFDKFQDRTPKESGRKPRTYRTYAQTEKLGL